LLVAAAGIVLPASACRVERPHPKLADAEQAKEPLLGLVGRINATYVPNDETKNYGQSIVSVQVTQDFTGKLPPTIFVLNPGCCVCVHIGGHIGDEVITIVRRGDDGLFYLAY
jgi:hypothetical protein